MRMRIGVVGATPSCGQRCCAVLRSAACCALPSHGTGRHWAALGRAGLVTYRGYWARVLLTLLKDYKGTISIADLSKETSFMTQDIISTLQNLNLIRYHQGQHVLLLTPEQLARKLKNAGSEGLRVDPSKIHWTPYTGGRDWS